MRKTAVLILLSSFLLNVLGFSNAFFLLSSKVARTAKVAHYQRLQGKEQMVVTLDKNHPSLTDFGFKRRSNSEYLYHGEHYDVVKRESTPNGDNIYLKHDTDEDEVMSFLGSLFGQQKSSHHNKAPIHKIEKQHITKYLNRAVGIYNKTQPTKYIRHLPVLIPKSPFRSVHIPPPKRS